MSEERESYANFEHSLSFRHGEVAGNLALVELESYYEELFAEVIEDGVITAEERARLDRMVDTLGLDRERVRKLETALQAAYQVRHQVAVRNASSLPPATARGPSELPGDATPPPIPSEPTIRASLAPLAPSALETTDPQVIALRRYCAFLEQRVAELELELTVARSNVAVEVDLSDVTKPSARPAPEEDVEQLERDARHDPRNERTLHALFRAYTRAGDPDRRFLVAHVLAYLRAMNDDEAQVYGANRTRGLIKPVASVSQDAWSRLLLHPEEEPVVGEIFAVVVPAVLLGRVSALRRDRRLPQIDPAHRQDPRTSTVQAVRCFGWGAAILGMSPPIMVVEPEYEGFVEMVPNVPPIARLGNLALSGRSAGELAFLAGRHLAHHRADHFVRTLVPQMQDLEEIFLAALTIGNPGLPMSAQVRQMVDPLARAIEPLLEPVSIDRLRGAFLRFVEDGGRTNLQRWSAAVAKTAARAGLLLCDDLKAARRVVEIEDPARVEEKMDDLLVFALSERYTKLRRQIGIALES